VKVARVLVATTPRLAEVLAPDWKMAARFYARYEITETQFKYGVPAGALADRIISWESGPEQYSSEASPFPILRRFES
jgi:hypothetical protein